MSSAAALVDGADGAAEALVEDQPNVVGPTGRVDVDVLDVPELDEVGAVGATHLRRVVAVAALDATTGHADRVVALPGPDLRLDAADDHVVAVGALDDALGLDDRGRLALARLDVSAWAGVVPSAERPAATSTIRTA